MGRTISKGCEAVVRNADSSHRLAVQVSGYAFLSEVLGSIALGYMLFKTYEASINEGLNPTFAVAVVLPFALIANILFFLTLLLSCVALGYSRENDFITSFGFALGGFIVLLSGSSFLYYVISQ